MTPVATSGSLFVILDGIQVFFHFYFDSLSQIKSKFISRKFFCKPGVVGRLTCPVQSYASTEAVGSTIYKFLLFHVFINIITIMVAIFLLSKETTFSFNHHSPSP